MKRIFAIVAGAAVLAVLPAQASADGLDTLVGSLHEHSGYSDGWPGTRPADFYASGIRYGLDFMGGSDHSDNLALPVTLSEGCAEALAPPGCALADWVNPADSFRKWDATAEQAQQAMAAKPGFSAFRGFEWTSDRFGHINVFFSRNNSNAKTDGGYVDMGTFWSWFTRAPALGGGSDGLGVFNHPGGKSIDGLSGFNWNDFAYVPAADERMVGIEVFNDNDEFGSVGGPYPAGSYVRALDKGWHVGAVGAEDLGHRKTDNWGGPQWPKTAVLAADRSPEAIRAALLDRRFYALAPGESALRLSFTVDGQPLGSRLDRPTGDRLAVRARTKDDDVALELVTSGGKVVGSDGAGSLRVERRAAEGEKYYFVRARRGPKIVTYSSPVWVRAVPDGSDGTWLAGDLHVHTCYSHDAYCGPGDDSGPEEFYSSGGTVAERFAEAALKGLDYLAITDHDNIRSWTDPDFGSGGVVGINGYEMSVAGHAQVLGAKKQYDKTDVPALVDRLRADGGVFQANHPADGTDKPFTSCAQAVDRPGKPTPLHWKYGFDLEPDTIEILNPTSQVAPAERFWECWLDRGARIGATGGSDSHGATNPTLGVPTTWVYARGRDRGSVLRALREGRTTVSRLPPALGGTRLLLEGDADGDGKYEAVIGDTVPPKAKLRVRAEGLELPGTVRVRANGKTVVERTLEPGATIELRAPDEPGWVRATLHSPTGPLTATDPTCEPRDIPISPCTYDLALLALTSPIYVERPRPTDPGGGDPGGGGGSDPGGGDPGGGGGSDPGGGDPGGGPSDSGGSGGSGGGAQGGPSDDGSSGGGGPSGGEGGGGAKGGGPSGGCPASATAAGGPCSRATPERAPTIRLIRARSTDADPRRPEFEIALRSSGVGRLALRARSLRISRTLTLRTGLNVFVLRVKRSALNRKHRLELRAATPDGKRRGTRLVRTIRLR